MAGEIDARYLTAVLTTQTRPVPDGMQDDLDFFWFEERTSGLRVEFKAKRKARIAR